MTTNTKRSKKPPAKTPEKVLILRTCKADMTSHGGFVWPTSGPVKAPDWNPKAECGNGLHGWLWGAGDWRLQIGGTDRKWLVFEAESKDLVQLDGKVKVESGDVLFVSSTWHEAVAFLRGRSGLVYESSATGYSGHASATGNYGHASATGDSGHASATGNYGHASATGDSGHASATGNSGHASATGSYGHASATGYSGHASATGYSGHASATGYSGHASATGYSGHASATGDSGHASATGNYGHASATGDSGHASATGDSGHASATGDSGHASATGNCGWAVSNLGTAKAGADGILTIRYKNANGKYRVAVGYVGECGIKPNVAYRVTDDGKFLEESK